MTRDPLRHFGIPSPNQRCLVASMLDGHTPIKDTYVRGVICHFGHGVNGESIRYRKGNRCIVCAGHSSAKSANTVRKKTDSNQKITKRALDVAEEKLDRERIVKEEEFWI